MLFYFLNLLRIHLLYNNIFINIFVLYNIYYIQLKIIFIYSIGLSIAFIKLIHTYYNYLKGFSCSDISWLRYVNGVFCFIDGYIHGRYYVQMTTWFYKYYNDRNIYGDAIISLYTHFCSLLSSHVGAAWRTLVDIILLRYRSELSPSSGGSWLFDAEEFPFPNPHHRPPLFFPLLFVDLLSRVFPSKSLYFFSRFLD